MLKVGIECGSVPGSLVLARRFKQILTPCFMSVLIIVDCINGITFRQCDDLAFS